MSGRMVNTNKFWCISFAANRERFSYLFVFFFFFFLFLSLFRLVLCYRASIQVYRLKYFLPIYPPLSTSFIISLSYYYFFDAALLVCVCYNSYFVLLGQICFSHFFSPFSQTSYYSRQEISTNLPVKIVM